MTETGPPWRPRVVLSVATSIDGYIDDTTPERLLLSNDADFDRVDQVRAESDAILVGAGVLRIDDPRLLVRSEERRGARVADGRSEHPLRITLTRSGGLDRSLRWFHTGGERLIYTVDATAPELAASVGDLADVAGLGASVDLAAVCADLHRRGVRQLMVEGGEQVHTAFLAAGLVDEIHLAITPLLVGDGPRFVGRAPFPWPSAHRMELLEHRSIGDVMLLRYGVTSPNVESADDFWLRYAVALADKCPPSNTAFAVGAAIVGADGQLLADGYSRETSPTVHAEQSALAKLGDGMDLAGATIYSSLEPCGQRASDPHPCAERIIKSGIRRVVFADSESTEFVESPVGRARLEATGVEVIQLDL